MSRLDRILFGPPGKAKASSAGTRSRGGPFRSRPLGVVRSSRGRKRALWAPSPEEWNRPPRPYFSFRLPNQPSAAVRAARERGARVSERWLRPP